MTGYSTPLRETMPHTADYFRERSRHYRDVLHAVNDVVERGRMIGKAEAYDDAANRLLSDISWSSVELSTNDGD